MRILGVDFGARRTGLALSDPLGVTCSPLVTIEEEHEDRLVDRIVATADEQRVTRIVVGLPRPLGGGSNRQSEAAEAFKDRLERRTTVPVCMWDERFTSKLAARGRSGSNPQDAVAACYMLQSYLDSQANFTEDS